MLSTRGVPLEGGQGRILWAKFGLPCPPSWGHRRGAKKKKRKGKERGRKKKRKKRGQERKKINATWWEGRLQYQAPAKKISGATKLTRGEMPAGQGRTILLYYSPQTLGNNFSTLGKNSKFMEEKKNLKENSKEIIKKNEIVKK